MEQVDAILQRPVVIALAILGAVVATIGGYLLRSGSRTDPRIARFVLRLGYAVTWASVAIFIVIGFRS